MIYVMAYLFVGIAVFASCFIVAFLGERKTRKEYFKCYYTHWIGYVHTIVNIVLWPMTLVGVIIYAKYFIVNEGDLA